MARGTPEENDAHWRKTRNLTIGVLVVWFIFSFVVHVFAKDLNVYTFLGFPLGYYLAVQGSLLVFVVLTFFQNARQDSIDDAFGHDD